MRYYEVLVADGHYHSNAPLTYSHESSLPIYSVVTIPLKNRAVTGFVIAEASALPQFKTKPIKAVVSAQPLPSQCIALARWLSAYYSCSLADALRQFAPTKPSVRRTRDAVEVLPPEVPALPKLPRLTTDQQKAISEIWANPSSTVVLHGDTATGKTRVYMELAKKTLASGKSVILLTPEISLTSQLVLSVRQHIKTPVHILHSQLSQAERKKIWFKLLEAKEPLVVVGARSALFSPLGNIGLIVLDEAHEPAYKQDQAPYYNATRVASQLAILTGAKAVLGSATPSVADYFLAQQKKAVVRMTQPAIANEGIVTTEVIDLKQKNLFSKNRYLSNKLIEDINTTLSDKKQVIIYLNRRGSARDILCSVCGWHYYCPNCDVSLIYHADQHLARCHICGYKNSPPVACPKCNNPEIIYRSIGTKALSSEVARLFPRAVVKRFDSDNVAGERLHESYEQILDGNVDILVGTQLLAKGLDLPRLALVGIVTAETSLSLPDFTSEERAFQLLYQIIGRVGRGHVSGKVVVQSFDPGNIAVRSALNRDWGAFYDHALIERRQFKFPPFSYLLQLICKRASPQAAEKAAQGLKKTLRAQKLTVEVIGPAPAFYAKRGSSYYYQLVIKSKNRSDLVNLARLVPSGWQINLDPLNLL